MNPSTTDIIISTATNLRITDIATLTVKQIDQNKKLVYVTPFNIQAKRIATELASIYHNAVIMTATAFRTHLLTVSDIECVILDDMHYINDPGQGHIWEEILILLPSTTLIIMIVSQQLDVQTLIPKIEKLRNKKIDLIKLDRTIPLQLCHLDHDLELVDISHTTYVPEISDDSVTQQLNRCICGCILNEMLPAFFFIAEPTTCESYCNDVASQTNLTNDQEKRIISEMIGTDLDYRLAESLCKGICYYHITLPMAVREIIEQLYEQNIIKVLFTTDFFLINLKHGARTIIFINPFDLQYEVVKQAGRLHLDKIGYALMLPLAPLSSDQFNLKQQLEPVPFISRLKINYHFVLRYLVNKYQSDIFSLIERTLYYADTEAKLTKLDKERDAYQEELCQLKMTQIVKYTDQYGDIGSFLWKMTNYSLKILNDDMNQVIAVDNSIDELNRQYKKILHRNIGGLQKTITLLQRLNFITPTKTLTSTGLIAKNITVENLLLAHILHNYPFMENLLPISIAKLLALILINNSAMDGNFFLKQSSKVSFDSESVDEDREDDMPPINSQSNTDHRLKHAFNLHSYDTEQIMGQILDQKLKIIEQNKQPTQKKYVVTLPRTFQMKQTTMDMILVRLVYYALKTNTHIAVCKLFNMFTKYTHYRSQSGKLYELTVEVEPDMITEEQILTNEEIEAQIANAIRRTVVESLQGSPLLHMKPTRPT